MISRLISKIEGLNIKPINRMIRRVEIWAWHRMLLRDIYKPSVFQRIREKEEALEKTNSHISK